MILKNLQTLFLKPWVAVECVGDHSSWTSHDPQLHLWCLLDSFVVLVSYMIRSTIIVDSEFFPLDLIPRVAAPKTELT